MVSKEIWNELNKLSKKELLKLFDFADIGLLDEDNDKDELVMIMSTESELKVKKALSKLN